MHQGFDADEISCADCGDTEISGKRCSAAESRTQVAGLPHGKKVSLCLSSIFRVSTIVPLRILQQQGQEEKEAQYMLPDLRVSVAAFCLADVCGKIGKGARGRVFATRCT